MPALTPAAIAQAYLAACRAELAAIKPATSTSTPPGTG